ncbi:MAG: hypothetical protein ACPHCJ_02080, partial [Oceanococcaceae bacterium]
MWISLGIVSLLGGALYTFWRRHLARWKGDRVRHRGQDFDVRVDRRGLLLGVDVRTNIDIGFRRERESDRFVKNIGLSREYQSGDPHFDKRVFVVCDRHAIVQTVLADASTRTQIESLVWYDDYHLYATRIHIRRGRLWVELDTHGGFDKAKTRPMLDKVIPSLHAIASDLERLKSPDWKPDQGAWM